MRRVLAATGALALAAGLVACGDSGSSAAGSGRPQVVVTTTVLGDVVQSMVGDRAEVEVLLPPGADPHEFALSARQATAMEGADLVVVNGGGLEQAMANVIDGVEDGGTPVVALTDHVEVRTFADDHDGEGNGDGAEGHGHDAGDVDPHVWTDPRRMADGAAALAERLAALDGVDADAVRERSAGYVAELEALDAEVADILAAVPDEDRVLVTNHEVLGYFAERYDFAVVGTVIPAGTTQAEPSSSALDDLAATIADTGAPAVFVETTRSRDLAETVADAAGGVEVVGLHTGSLGEEGSGADTYVGLVRTNAERIADALT